MNVTPLHLGSLHPIEQALTLVLAFGPFVLLGVVVLVRRRHDLAEERAAERPEAVEPVERVEPVEGQRER